MYKYSTNWKIDRLEDGGITADMLHEEEYIPKPSGILDQYGRMLYKERDEVPFGFHIYKEE